MRNCCAAGDGPSLAAAAAAAVAGVLTPEPGTPATTPLPERAEVAYWVVGWQ